MLLAAVLIFRRQEWGPTIYSTFNVYLTALAYKLIKYTGS